MLNAFIVEVTYQTTEIIFEFWFAAAERGPGTGTTGSNLTKMKYQLVITTLFMVRLYL